MEKKAKQPKKVTPKVKDGAELTRAEQKRTMKIVKKIAKEFGPAIEKLAKT